MNIVQRIYEFFFPPITDEVFGILYRDGKTWQGGVSFRHEPTRTTTLMVTVETPDKKSRPTAEQRELFLQIVARYATLWPDIAAALVKEYPHLESVERVTQLVENGTSLYLEPIVQGTIPTWQLQFTFDHPDEAYMGYFVNVQDWKVVRVDAGD